MRQRRTTLRDVATAAGVSMGTASYALNGNPLVKAETRARVLEAARRLAYGGDRAAGRLAGRSECIGVAVDRIVAPAITGATFYATVVQGITTALEEHGYALRLVHLDDETAPAASPGARRPLTADVVDGVIALNYMDPLLMERLRRVGVPLVVLDASGAYPEFLSVDNDDRGGVATGIGYLLELGHRHIAFLNETLAHPFGREALAGYLQAYEHGGVPIEPWLLRTSDWGIAGGYASMTAVLAGSRLPTAVFAVSDEMAVGAIQAIHEAGYNVPDDMSVMGMDDVPLAAQVRPALTTVKIDMEALGRQAVELALRAIDDLPLASPHVVLPTQLMIRASTAPLPAGPGAPDWPPPQARDTPPS